MTVSFSRRVIFREVKLFIFIKDVYISIVYILTVQCLVSEYHKGLSAEEYTDPPQLSAMYVMEFGCRAYVCVCLCARTWAGLGWR